MLSSKASSSVHGLPAQLPGINVEASRKRIGCSSEFFTGLLLQFRRGYATMARQIRESLARGEKDTAARLAHSLKGVAGNIGAVDIQAVAAELEAWITRNGTDGIEPLLDTLEKNLDQVLRSLSNLVEPAGKETQPVESAGQDECTVIDLSKITIVMIDLAERLSKNNPEAGECLTLMKQYLCGAGLDEKMEQLEDQVGNYDFDGALLTLITIAQVLDISLEGGAL